jgi:hypothetical protein
MCSIDGRQNALRREGGRDVAKISLTLAAIAVAFVFLSVQGVGQTAGPAHNDLKASFLGSALACSQTQPATERVLVPQPLAKRARLKARLLNLLRLSLYDDSKGIVNAAREKEIADVARKLKDEKPE